MSGLENRPSQTQQIVDLLRESGTWVPLPAILALRISQYSARIFQARHQWGLTIENKIEIVNGEKHTWFRLVESLPVPSALRNAECKPPSASTVPTSLFGDISRERTALDYETGRTQGGR